MTYSKKQRHPRFLTSGKADLGLPTKEIAPNVSLYDVSLGGLFAELASPPPPGTLIGVRIKTDGQRFLARARIVHVVDEEIRARTGHPTGAGLRFENLLPGANEALAAFLADLESAAASIPDADDELPQDLGDQGRRWPRFVTDTQVEVRGDNDEIRTLWMRDISKGGLFVQTESPPALHTKVDVTLILGTHPVSLHAEVVHRLDVETAQQYGAPPGAGLAFSSLDENDVNLIASYIEGREVVAPADDAPRKLRDVHEVIATVKLLFQGIEAGNPHAALGLPDDAAPIQVDKRITELASLFNEHPGEATPPQRARIGAAQRALNRIRRDHAAKRLRASASTLGTVQLPPETASASGSVDGTSKSSSSILITDEERRELEGLIAEAEQKKSVGDLTGEQRALGKLVDRAPDDMAARRQAEMRLQNMKPYVDALRAQRLIDSATTYARAGMAEKALGDATAAVALSERDEILLPALTLFVRLRDDKTANRLAEDILRRDAKNLAAMRAMVVLHHRAKRFSEAKAIVKRVLKLKPDDAKMKKFLKEMS